MKEKCRIGVLASGGGSNLQALLDACAEGTLPGQIVFVASDRESAYALERAQQQNVHTEYMGRKRFAETQDRYQWLLEQFAVHRVELVVLAGYLGILPDFFVEALSGRMINIHPSLLPKFGGKGFYGNHVHRAVLASGERITGATVHFVQTEIDTGPILAQRSVALSEQETVESIQQKVIAVEHGLLVEAVGLWIEKYHTCEPR